MIPMIEPFLNAMEWSDYLADFTNDELMSLVDSEYAPAHDALAAALASGTARVDRWLLITMITIAPANRAPV